MEVPKRAQRASATCAGRSCAAWSAVSRGAKPARRGLALASPVEGKRRAQVLRAGGVMDQTAWPATRHETRGAAHEPDAGAQIKGPAYTQHPSFYR